jgi:hypothetical protein
MQMKAVSEVRAPRLASFLRAALSWRISMNDNPFSPGSGSYGQKVAALRRAFVSAITPQDIATMAGKLVEMAEAGNVQAAKLLFSYWPYLQAALHRRPRPFDLDNPN